VRAVIDPGVLVAGLIKPDGTCGEVVYGMAEYYAAIVSPQLLDELAEVLGRRKFRRYLSLEEAEAAVRAVAGLALLVDDDPDPDRVSPDPDDDYLVALARASGADVLVSGDSDLAELTDLGVRVLRPREFVELLRARAAD
jgi:putative PIN family toxin of toxin-antitoxin system